MFVKNSIGRFSIDLVKKHFKQDTLLGKLFNKNNLNLSFSCSLRVMARISAHDRKLLIGRKQKHGACHLQL